MKSMNFRIGLGTDRHRLVVGRPMILGGVDIPSEKGLLGHSDADAVLHAVSDALLGALSQGDIGDHFPDTDPQNRGISSERILSKCLSIVLEAGWEISNVDVVIQTEMPKIGPHRKVMRQNLSRLLKLQEGQVSIKAKTAEGLGAVGREECLDVQAVVLLSQ